jgi:haloalkane dehalogenase
MTTQAKEVLRTPVESFAELEAFPYEPRYLDVEGFRTHYVDEGPTNAPPVLLVHGWPTWSYLWRNVIPPLLTAGHRVIAPDLVGFGRSDKPAAREDLGFGDQVRCLRGLVSTLDLSGMTLVCHDWGGMVGLRAACGHADRFAGIVVVNSLLPTGDQAPGENFLAWQWATQATGEFSPGEVVNQGCRKELPEQVLDAYDAPYRGAEGLDGAAREFPMLIPTRPVSPDAIPNAEAWNVFGSWEKPFVTLWSDAHPVVGGGDRFWREGVPGAAGCDHVTVEEPSFYLIEDRPELITEAVVGLRPSDA